MLNLEVCNEIFLGEWPYNSMFHDFGTRWMWIASFTPRPLYPRKSSSLYPLNRSIYNRSGDCGEERIASAWNLTLAIQPFSRHCSDWVIPVHYTNYEASFHSVFYSHLMYNKPQLAFSSRRVLLDLSAETVSPSVTAYITWFSLLREFTFLMHILILKGLECRSWSTHRLQWGHAVV
jgi:hypothetical protein